MIANPLPIRIRPNERDMRTLIRGFSRAERELGQTFREACNFASKMVAYSLQASTAEAKAYRKYSATERKTGKQTVYRVYSDRKKNYFHVAAPSVRILKTMPQVRIARRGLAKNVWKIIGAQIPGPDSGIKAGRDNANARTVRQAPKFGRVTIRGGRQSPHVILRNDLPYALAAIKGGRAEVNRALGRGFRRMHKMITFEMKKRLGTS